MRNLDIFFSCCIVFLLITVYILKSKLDITEEQSKLYHKNEHSAFLWAEQINEQTNNTKRQIKELIPWITSLQDKIHTNHNLYVQLNERFNNFKYDTDKRIKKIYCNINNKIEQLNNEVLQLYNHLNLGLLRPVTQEEIDDRRRSTQNSDRCPSTTQGYKIGQVFRVYRTRHRRQCKTWQNEFKSKLGR